MASTFSSLHYHVIFATKNREPFLTKPMRGRMHAFLAGCINRIGAVPLEIGGVEDHVHALLRLKPTHCVADVLREIKRPSSDWASRVCRTFRWQDGYSAFTVARSQLDRVRLYISGQEEHHRGRTFEEEYREFLEAHGIAFEERFLL